jgi:hypothetical protein
MLDARMCINIQVEDLQQQNACLQQLLEAAACQSRQAEADMGKMKNQVLRQSERAREVAILCQMQVPVLLHLVSKLPSTRSTACSCILASRPGFTTPIGLLSVTFTLAIMPFRVYVRLSPVYYIGRTAGQVDPHYAQSAQRGSQQQGCRG